MCVCIACNWLIVLGIVQRHQLWSDILAASITVTAHAAMSQSYLIFEQQTQWWIRFQYPEIVDPITTQTADDNMYISSYCL